VAPGHALAPHAAVGADDQPLDRDVFQRAADVVGDLLGTLDLQRVMINYADRDLLVGDDLAAKATFCPK